MVIFGAPNGGFKEKLLTIASVRLINKAAIGGTSQRVEVPIKNERNKQTYYGALNYKTKQFSLLPADSGNGKNTRKFLKYLQGKNQVKRQKAKGKRQKAIHDQF